MNDPARRVVINAAVCEGCGDCSVQSNCISVEPLETPLGRKRTINQSSCNKDFSCLKGFCPSFVTVEGGRLRQHAQFDLTSIGDLPLAPARTLERPYNIAIGGVGGTGVLTIGALLGMAAHIEGKASMILDVSGLAQKGGAVLSHVQIARDPTEVTCSHIVTGAADLLIAADEFVAAAKETLLLCEPLRTRGVVNTHLIPTADFIRSRDFNFRQRSVSDVLKAAILDKSLFFDFTHAAEILLGDSIATNMMMLGYTCQQGLLPVSADSIIKAIELNGISSKMNIQAFTLGRLASADPARLSSMLVSDATREKTQDEMSLDEIIAHRSALLLDYQGPKLVSRYRALVERTRTTVSRCGFGEELPRIVAINYAKLLAYKDEYEVARLFTGDTFRRSISDQFEGDFVLRFHLAPPFLPTVKDELGRPRKRTLGSWVMRLFWILSKLRGLRGTPFDMFGYSPDRRLERELIENYEDDVTFLIERLTPQNIETVTKVLSLPDAIRGYGPVKQKAAADARLLCEALMKDIIAPPPPMAALAAE